MSLTTDRLVLSITRAPAPPGPPPVGGRRERHPLGRAAAATLALVLVFGYMDGVRPWMASWGATPAETERRLPGDARVPWPQMVATRAVTIEAPPGAVWPWLAQLGTGRGGWYSYDWLDNGGRPSADRVIPALQGVRVGDRIPMTPGGAQAFPVFLVDPPRTLGLGGPFAATADPAAAIGAAPITSGATWVMHLEPVGGHATRLIVRYRMAYEPGFLGALGQAVLEPVHFIMERKMLRELQRRVSRPGPERLDPPPGLHAGRGPL